MAVSGGGVSALFWVPPGTTGNFAAWLAPGVLEDSGIPIGGGGVSIGGSVVGGTVGSILFIGAASVLAQDNANFFWDDTNFILKVGHAAGMAQYWLNGVPALYEVPNASGNNWFEGNAGNATLTGSGNFGTGDTVLANLTTGSGNLALGGTDSTSPFGLATAESLTTGGAGAVGNVAIGASALCNVTTGFGNLAIGSRVLESTAFDAFNVGLGSGTLSKLGAAGAGAGSNQNNIAISNGALNNLITGAGLIGIGVSAGGNLASSVVGGDVFIGGNAGGNIGSTNGFNTMVGSGAGFFITSGDGNTIIGRWLASAAAISNVIALAYGNNNLAADYNFTTANVWTFAQAILFATSVALTNSAAANLGTLTNAPAAGNPTKWISINDNGTTRFIPAW